MAKLNIGDPVFTKNPFLKGVIISCFVLSDGVEYFVVEFEGGTWTVREEKDLFFWKTLPPLAPSSK